jgi:hypothetical protein
MRNTTPPERPRARARVDRRATIRLSRGLRVVVRAVDLSTTGIGILYSAPAEVGARLEIELGLPVDGRLIALKLNGEVLHCHLKGGEYYSVLKLIDPTDQERDTIKRFIRARELQRLCSV